MHYSGGYCRKSRRNIPITDKNLYVPFVTLSTQDNTKLLEQLKSVFKRAISWNKYQSIMSKERSNQRLDYLNDPSFQGVNRLFVLSSENEALRTSYKRYYLLTEEIKKIKCYDWLEKRFWSTSNK